LFFVADLNLGIAFEDYVEFVLSGVGVGGVLLAGFKAIEASEESLAAGDVGLGHLLWREFGVGGEVLYDHLGGCGYA